jgi:hypothetical protein
VITFKGFSVRVFLRFRLHSVNFYSWLARCICKFHPGGLMNRCQL